MYDDDEVQVIVESYLEVNRNLGLWRHRLIDVDRCLPQVPENLRNTLFLIGIAGLSFNQASAYLEVDSTTVMRRFYNGVTWLTSLMNGRRPNLNPKV